MTKNYKPFFYKYKKGVFIICVIIIFVIVLRVFFVDMYEIKSSSMNPTLVSGDYIIVSKMSYGTRFIKIRRALQDNVLEYSRIKGWGAIKERDVIVFNWPKLRTPDNAFGGFIVKRCYGLPGDTVKIENTGVESNSVMEVAENIDLFPHDTTLKWRLDNYGPLYVPAKGHTMQLSARNVCWYKPALDYERRNSQIKENLSIMNGEEVQNYVFTKDYFFMVGDNFYSSIDSRYWGFVPEDHIIGKAVLVLFSIDKEKPGLKKIRLERCLKKV